MTSKMSESRWGPPDDLTKVCCQSRTRRFRVKTDPQFFSCSIWLMSGTERVAKVWLDGAKGKGEIAIPFTSYAQRVLPLGRAPGVALFGLMMFLAAGVVAIVSAGVREGSLDPGGAPAPGQIRRARIAAAAAAILVAAIILAGKRMVGRGSARTSGRT